MIDLRQETTMRADEAAEHNRKAWAQPGPGVPHDRCLRRHEGRYGVACHHCADWIASRQPPIPDAGDDRE